MDITNKDLKNRIIDISYKNKLSHLGSCLTAVDIIDMIFRSIQKGDRFVLSQGHAGLAYYVVAEKYLGIDAEKALKECGIHPDRQNDTQGFIEVSIGSLGMGLPIALGMAMADKQHKIFCLISDGESMEGSIQESLNVKDRLHVDNLIIFSNVNGYEGYGQSFDYPMNVTKVLTDVEYLPFLNGLAGHYYTMNEEDYKLAKEILK